MYPGLAGTLVENGNVDTHLVREMHRLADAIYQAKQRNDKVAAESLLDQFKAVASEYGARGNDLTATDRFVLAVGDWIEKSIDAIPSAIAALPKAIGSGLFQAAIPFALLYLGFIYLSSRKRL